jgi:hypothetical protein
MLMKLLQVDAAVKGAAVCHLPLLHAAAAGPFQTQIKACSVYYTTDRKNRPQEEVYYPSLSSFKDNLPVDLWTFSSQSQHDLWPHHISSHKEQQHVVRRNSDSLTQKSSN